MLSYSAPRTILIPNDTFSESCCRDLPNDALFGADTLVDVEQSSFENRSRGCVVLCHQRYIRHMNEVTELDVDTCAGRCRVGRAGQGRAGQDRTG